MNMLACLEKSNGNVGGRPQTDFAGRDVHGKPMIDPHKITNWDRR